MGRKERRRSRASYLDKKGEILAIGKEKIESK